MALLPEPITTIGTFSLFATLADRCCGHVGDDHHDPKIVSTVDPMIFCVQYSALVMAE